MKKDQVHMELIANISLELIDKVEEKIELTKEDSDKLFDIIHDNLEAFFNYPDYRNYN